MVLSVSSSTTIATTDTSTLVRIPDLLRRARNKGLASTLAFSRVKDIVSGADGIGGLCMKKVRRIYKSLHLSAI